MTSVVNSNKATRSFPFSLENNRIWVSLSQAAQKKIEQELKKDRQSLPELIFTARYRDGRELQLIAITDLFFKRVAAVLKHTKESSAFVAALPVFIRDEIDPAFLQFNQFDQTQMPPSWNFYDLSKERLSIDCSDQGGEGLTLADFQEYGVLLQFAKCEKYQQQFRGTTRIEKRLSREFFCEIDYSDKWKITLTY